MTARTHRLHWTRDDRAANRWPSVAFEVPDGSRAVGVELAYDDSGGAVLDLGCAGAAGWRGWSGGARRSFTVAGSWATPGYLPGPLEPGEWQVVLGLHRVPPSGVDATVTITAGDAHPEPAPPWPRRPQRPPRRELPAPDGLRWVAADLHAHTLHSDGALTVPELAALAVANGLDALAVTDHNTVSHHAELAEVGAHYGIALLPGQEVTTDTGHANAFGDVGWVDFRRPAADWVSTVDECGGLLSVNHPLGGDCSWRQPVPVRPPLAEVWHSSWLAPAWGGPLAWWRAWGMDATPVGGSDFHRPGDRPPGTPTTWVAVDAGADGPAELTTALLAGLRAGRTAVSAGVSAPVLLPFGGGGLLALGAAGSLLCDTADSRTPVTTDRATLSGGDGGAALVDHDGGIVALCGG